MRLLPICSLVVLLSWQANAQILIQTPSTGKHQHNHELEAKVNNLINPTSLAEQIVAEAESDGKKFTTHERKSLKDFLMHRFLKKRREIYSQLKSGSMSFVSAEWAVLEMKLKMTKRVYGMSAQQLEKITRAHEQNENKHMPVTRDLDGPCLNPDFETCDFSDWWLIDGSVPFSPTAPFSFTSAGPDTAWSTVSTSNPTTSATSDYDQHYICNGGVDAVGGFPMVFPGGTCSAAIGDFWEPNNGAAQIKKKFLVSSGDAILTLNYAVCLEDAGHTALEQPYFRARVYDEFGGSITCAAYEAYAGDGQPGWIWNSAQGYFYKPWTTVFIPLAPYVGQNVTVEFTVGDCSQGGHAAYAYIDASCSAMAFDMSASAICDGDPIIISAPPGAASYLWSTGDTTQTINVPTDGTYSVVVTPITGTTCSITLDTTVYSEPNPIAAFSFDSPQCPGIPVNFTDNSDPNGNTITGWAWDFGDGSTSALQNPSHAYLATGTYIVTLTVITPSGCNDSHIDTLILPPGTPPVITPAGPFCSNSEPVTLAASIPYGYWQADCDSCLDSLSGVFNPAEALLGVNVITYTACMVFTDTVEITVFESMAELSDYNIFTPNGDGMNDKFYPIKEFKVFDKSQIENYIFLVYDRWGVEVFSSTDPQDAWNGKKGNGGKAMAEGVYFWIVRAEDFCTGDQKEITGYVHLTR